MVNQKLTSQTVYPWSALAQQPIFEEICSQPHAVADFLENAIDLTKPLLFPNVQRRLKQARGVVMTGMGSSENACFFANRVLSHRLRGEKLPVRVVSVSDLGWEDLTNKVVCIISQSGRTQEIASAIKQGLFEDAAFVLAITNAPDDSPLAEFCRHTGHVFPLNVVEKATPATVSYTKSVLTALAVSAVLLQNSQEGLCALLDEIRPLPQILNEMLSEGKLYELYWAAKDFASIRWGVIVADGLCASLLPEGDLKGAEMDKLALKAIKGSFMAHGALNTPHYEVALHLQDLQVPQAVHQQQLDFLARHFPVYTIGPWIPLKAQAKHLATPQAESPLAQVFVYLVVLQIFYAFAALHRGEDPVEEINSPRRLSKVVLDFEVSRAQQ